MRYHRIIILLKFIYCIISFHLIFRPSIDLKETVNEIRKENDQNLISTCIKTIQKQEQQQKQSFSEQMQHHHLTQQHSQTSQQLHQHHQEQLQEKGFYQSEQIQQRTVYEKSTQQLHKEATLPEKHQHPEQEFKSYHVPILQEVSPEQEGINKKIKKEVFKQQQQNQEQQQHHLQQQQQQQLDQHNQQQQQQQQMSDAEDSKSNYRSSNEIKTTSDYSSWSR